MAASSLTKTYESLPIIAKVLIQIFFGAVVGGVYRIVKFFEKRNTLTLIVGILNFVGLGLVFWIVDLYTEITVGKITFLAD